MTEKEKFLRKFNRAFADNNTDYIAENTTDNIIWNILGDRIIQGKDAFLHALKEMENKEIFEPEIEHIITHGRAASVNGVMRSGNGTSYAFCDVYTFSGFKNPKVKEITSYVIRISNNL